MNNSFTRALTVLMLAASLAIPVVAQTPAPPSAFSDTTITFSLTPITLPGAKTSLAGDETDVFVALTPNNQVGETTLISGNYSFIGGRYNRFFPSISNWLNNHSPNLNGMQFQFGLTASVGVVRAPSPTLASTNVSHFGERVGGTINYEINNTWGLGLEVQYVKFPGVANNTYSIALGPNFHF